jgi:hypothetical protein
MRRPVDIGEALAQEQMEEYAQAHAALSGGSPLVRLTWATRAGVVLLVVGVAWWLTWSVVTGR